MTERYNVYFAGQVMEGHDPIDVRAKLAKVFNADQPTLDKLFSGKAQLIKRNCDKATALKFEGAMQRAGAAPMIKRIEPEAASSGSGPSHTPSAAERIAALAAAPVAERFGTPEPARPPERVQPEEAPAEEGINLAPVGTEVLRQHERAAPVIREVDTSHLEVDDSGQRLSREPSPSPAMPDTSHLNMGEVGDTIPNLPSNRAPIAPNTDKLDLSPDGWDLSDCAAPEPESLPLDLSALSLAQPESELLEAKYKKHTPGVAPSTDHISLDD
jgi:hypothetical protein